MRIPCESGSSPVPASCTGLLCSSPLQGRQDVSCCTGVQAGGRLVHEQQGGLGHQLQANVDPLPLPTTAGRRGWPWHCCTWGGACPPVVLRQLVLSSTGHIDSQCFNWLCGRRASRQWQEGRQSVWAMCCLWRPLLCHRSPDAALLHRADHRVLHGAQTENIDDVIHQVPLGTAAHILWAAQPAGRAPTISLLQVSLRAGAIDCCAACKGAVQYLG